MTQIPEIFPSKYTFSPPRASPTRVRRVISVDSRLPQSPPKYNRTNLLQHSSKFT